jgi:hypothetical protein
MAEYNRGQFPEGVTPPQEEVNFYLQPEEPADTAEHDTSLATG